MRQLVGKLLVNHMHGLGAAHDEGYLSHWEYEDEEDLCAEAEEALKEE